MAYNTITFKHGTNATISADGTKLCCESNGKSSEFLRKTFEHGDEQTNLNHNYAFICDISDVENPKITHVFNNARSIVMNHDSTIVGVIEEYPYPEKGAKYKILGLRDGNYNILKEYEMPHKKQRRYEEYGFCEHKCSHNGRTHAVRCYTHSETAFVISLDYDSVRFIEIHDSYTKSYRISQLVVSESVLVIVTAETGAGLKKKVTRYSYNKLFTSEDQDISGDQGDELWKETDLYFDLIAVKRNGFILTHGEAISVHNKDMSLVHELRIPKLLTTVKNQPVDVKTAVDDSVVFIFYKSGFIIAYSPTENKILYTMDPLTSDKVLYKYDMKYDGYEKAKDEFYESKKTHFSMTPLGRMVVYSGPHNTFINYV